MLRYCAVFRYTKKLSESVNERKGEISIDHPKVFLECSEKSSFDIDIARKT